MSARIKQIMKKLRELSDKDIAAHSQRFFKTGKGEYGEGDRFLGIRVPPIRKCVKEYRSISLEDTLKLLKSPFHEARLLALLMLVAKYSSTNKSTEQGAIYRSYLSHTKYINNWDLVDCSAQHIVGAHLFSRDRKTIYRLIRSKNLWERRIGVMATFHFIRKEAFSDTLIIAESLLDDQEDLIHKAVGWMLREVGNRNRDVEEKFLTKHYKEMPRTMLRYAIEKLPEIERLAYLHGIRDA
ncbi:MAG: DNA alkylation repair protein [Desulfobacterales bacterium]|nr:DNA alkylation repair protein [Desulfobacterales bacterium]